MSEEHRVPCKNRYPSVADFGGGYKMA